LRSKTAAPDILERIEAEAWAEHQQSSPPAIEAEFGVDVRRVGSAVALLAVRGDMLGMNRVVGLGLESDSHAGLADEVFDVYRNAGVARFLVFWSPAANPDVRARLETLGCRHFGRMAKLYREPSPEVAARTDVSITVIDGERALEYGRTVAAAHGDPPALIAAHAATVGRPNWRHYLARSGEQSVAGATLFWKDGAAWCGFSATLPSERGRGAHSALLAQRIRDAAALGCEWVVCETAEDRPERPNPAYRNMRRAGFELAYLRDVLIADLKLVR
jgi:GNAT superfamily N-acetyltransferase